MELRWYQEKAIDSIFEYFDSGNQGNPVVAMPTGTGKSLVIGGFLKRAKLMFPDERFMALTHVKELIDQNANKLQQMWDTAPMGIYSAGLNQRDTVMPIIFGGSASVVNCIEKFGKRGLLLVDECHLISPKAETTYQIIIEGLKQFNPALKVVGFTATPFRLGQGMITDGGIFTDICCDFTGVEPFNRFIEEGFLCPLYPRRTKTELDVSNVSVTAGEFNRNALQEAVDQHDVTYKALVELCEAGETRNSWLIFASGVEHAEHINTMLNSFGVKSAAIHSKISAKERDKLLKAYKYGEIRCLVNNNVLTTGFDHPPLDLIGMLRPTMSPGLWVQMLGRGTRPSPETNKTDCLVLDFAGNARRLGPINDPVIPRRKGKGGGDAPVRICDECGTYNHAAARFCICCGMEFTFREKIVATASTEELIRSDVPVIEHFNVGQVHYFLHQKIGQPNSIRVEYYCEGGFHKFNEFICLEHSGYASKHARDWWRKRFPGEYVPDTVQQALSVITQLKVPYRIKVHVNKKHPEILGHEFY